LDPKEIVMNYPKKYQNVKVSQRFWGWGGRTSGQMYCFC
jgi:hypothetical protein